YGQREVRAYLASRLSGSFAAVTNVFSEAARDSRVPTPTSVLDFGTGPGTAIWAAHARWGNSINSYTGIDISEPMLDSAEALLSQPAEQFINSTHTPIPQDLETASPDWDARPSPDKVSLLRYLTPLRDDAEPTHDLVVAAFTLSELPTPAIRADTVNQLWRRTRQTLVVIDHGSLNGSELVRAVRSQLLETGDAEIIGPCQHAGTCPMTGTQQACMFSQRYWISGLSRTMTGDKRDLNDQRYSYIIIKRKNEEEGAPGQLVSTDPSKWARVMIPPIKKTGQVLADVCTSEGTLERQLFSKRLGKEVYRALRKTMWGDLVPYRP
ncbi:Rsm22-domain-containing protein, partial [Ramicandelaber brevisporus]